MRKFLELARSFRDDEDGAAMIEYTVLIGLITVSLLLVIGLVATQLGVRWTALQTALTP